MKKKKGKTNNKKGERTQREKRKIKEEVGRGVRGKNRRELVRARY